MPSTRDIRRRIKSVKNTAQITKAMQMVAASKMRKAQLAALAGKPYAELTNSIISALKGRVDEEAHPLLRVRPVHKRIALVVSTDKGLCGALNGNLMREAFTLDAASTSYVTIGRKAVQYVTRAKRQLLADFPMKDAPSFAEVKTVSRFLIEKFLSGECDEVSLVYTDFINTLNQKPTVRHLLPIVRFEELEAGVEDQKVSREITGGATEFLFKPDRGEVLDFVLPSYVHFMVYQILLDARASEHSARMVAMKNATDNAKQLVKDLTLDYNKIRQASITTEILEIATAQAAMS
ncbi:MAG: ATP synthase F1 subunit gamma [Verrucomicrobiae bacterium]|nr:ATP synthase F1 subunit gamma [Verrucomicrobiae bacterium]